MDKLRDKGGGVERWWKMNVGCEGVGQLSEGRGREGKRSKHRKCQWNVGEAGWWTKSKRLKMGELRWCGCLMLGVRVY